MLHTTSAKSYHLQLANDGKLEISLKSIPSEPVSECAASASQSLVHVSGGLNEHGFLTSTCFAFPVGEDSYLTKPLPAPRARHGSTFFEGKFIIAGGVTDDSNGGLGLAKDVLSYDPESDRWDEVAELPRRSAQLVVECIGDRLFIIGGDTGTTTQPGNPIAPARCRPDVQILNLRTGKWTSGKPKPIPETGVTSAVLGAEIFVVSSYPPDGVVSATVEVYNTEADKWRRIPDMPTPRTGVPCGFLNGRLYCINGQGPDLRPVAAFEVYDPVADQWMKLPARIDVLFGQGYAATARELILFGGRR
jgi:N-acetylneuraminic acid mutarotase